ncbi:hypothetical protein IU397_16250 [Actibacterium sp. 188UL27-1]|nr:hypothetical protein [Actibacterium sp. 188UL27-1]
MTCAWGLETVEDPIPALAQFLRVSRPGGHICLVFCADRPAASPTALLFRQMIERRGLGQFLNCACISAAVIGLGGLAARVLHFTGPAAALLLTR